MKREKGIGGVCCSYMQNLGYYIKSWTDVVTDSVAEKSNCPSILVELTGPEISLASTLPFFYIPTIKKAQIQPNYTWWCTFSRIKKVPKIDLKLHRSLGNNTHVAFWCIVRLNFGMLLFSHSHLVFIDALLIFL